MKENARGSGSSQVALSLVLLIGSGLFLRTLGNLEDLDTGFHHEGVLLVNLDPRRAGYKDATLGALYTELLARLSVLPGVQSVSLSANTPLSGSIWTEPVSVEGRPAQAAAKQIAHINTVAPRYFETMGTPLLLGRDFTIHDNPAAPLVAIVNQAFVRRFLDETPPLGRPISVLSASTRSMTVVGVVKDAVSFTLRAPAPPAVYLPYFQTQHMASATFEVLEAGPPARVTALVRQNIHNRLPDAPLIVGTFSEQVNRSLVQERLVATLSSFFGVLALGLAAVGLYGLIAYGVARRTAEIGIRMALGAKSENVLWLVLRGTLRLVIAGIVAGLPLVWAASRLVSALLFGLNSTDPLTIAAATAILLAVATVAGFLPARRALKVDPMVALRYE